MTTLATDTCIRSDQSGLGTASDGQVWSVNGTMTTSIASNEAVITASSGFPSAFLGTKTTADINFLMRLEQNNNVFDGIGPCFRCVDSANMYFVAAYAGSGGLVFAKLVSGGFTQLGSGSFTLNINTFYWIRVVMSGSHLQARIWADGSSEPSTWTIDTTDTTYSAAGQFGVSTNTFSQGTDTVKFDSITVTDNSSGPVTTTYSFTDVVTLSDGPAATDTALSVEALNPTENFLAGNASMFTDAGSASDSLTFITVNVMSVTETLVLSDSIQASTTLLVIEPLQGNDTLLGTAQAMYSDVLTIVDSLIASEVAPPAIPFNVGLLVRSGSTMMFLRSGTALAGVRSGTTVLEVRE